MIVVGVDGCKGGWVAATVDLGNDNAQLIRLQSFTSFEALIDASPEAPAIAVDIPIGLIRCQRAADVEARGVLGPRKSSVFPAPDPRVLHCDDYWEANGSMQEECGKGISKQAFALIPKIREVNEVVRRRDPEQTRIIEIHPEICFWALNGERAMSFPKREDEGYDERRRLLDSWLSEPLWERPKVAAKQAMGAAADDILDSIVAAWSAQWWAFGIKNRFPRVPERDEWGLRAEIVY